MKTDKERDETPLQPACNIQQQLEEKELIPSELASALINDLTSAYVEMLYEESKRVARRRSADHEVSTNDVKKALGILKEREERNWKKGVSGIAAGALFCVPLAPLTSLSSAASIPIYQHIISSLCLVLLLARYSVSD